MKSLVKRLLYIPVILFLLFTITFFLVRMAPGDPFSQDKELNEATKEELNKKYHP